MNDSTITIRLMKADDFDAVVGIDEKVLKASRPEYYEMKFEKLFKSKDYLPTSLVAEDADGTVTGFVMGRSTWENMAFSRKKPAWIPSGLIPIPSIRVSASS
jgi:hypothetical protein